MAKTIEQVITLAAPPARVYRMYLSARQHQAACGGWGKAGIDARVGGRMAMSPYIRGRVLALVPGRMIVQTWRGNDWKKSDLDSVLLLTFERAGKGCRLTMVHANVPDHKAKSIGSRTDGWYKHYWRPWTAYLSKHRGR
jgi:uncharacterized protein YndB with AHSA1/START domain